ncbi:MAG: 1-acyl-sn-glycerol-3-phosphate acyltransferase [Tannerella sp.]|jgi:1-acyl-sn-glycerol-3-phosphate acyltransferase|nr:1-acyl-sn-glycerol-3-phosphate acyltransferase [Tannerella sp.]
MANENDATKPAGSFPEGLIDIRRVLETKAPALARKLPRFLVNYLKRIVHQDEINDILRCYHDKDGLDFMDALIAYFGLTLECSGREQLPREGRFIFASNHPLGGLDGICLASVLGRLYKEQSLRVPVNDLLLFIPNLRSIFVPVNKHGRQARAAASQTEAAYASACQVLTFPAGLCSRRHRGKVADVEWKKSFIQKAVEYKRDVVPVFFEGKNSNFFYRLANLRSRLGIKANLEMLYLADELFKSKHSSYHIRFGAPVPWTCFDKSRTPSQWAAVMRDACYGLNK